LAIAIAGIPAQINRLSEDINVITIGLLAQRSGASFQFTSRKNAPWRGRFD
jgi:hypothetical protein